MVDERFTELTCELLGIKSPAEIKQEELIKLLQEHFGDATEENYIETDGGIIFRKIEDSEPDEEERPEPVWRDSGADFENQ